MIKPKDVLDEVVTGLFGVALYACYFADRLQEKVKEEKHKRKHWTEEQKQLQVLAGIRNKDK